jgi:hypothetical protein
VKGGTEGRGKREEGEKRAKEGEKISTEAKAAQGKLAASTKSA